MEQIAHAAIRVENMIVFARSHYECTKHLKPKQTFLNRNCGFFTNSFRFVSRQEAKHIAVEAGQISEDNAAKTFISERLWSAREGGIHDYDEVYGYVPRKVMSPGGE